MTIIFIFIIIKAYYCHRCIALEYVGCCRHRSLLWMEHKESIYVNLIRDLPEYKRQSEYIFSFFFFIWFCMFGAFSAILTVCAWCVLVFFPICLRIWLLSYVLQHHTGIKTHTWWKSILFFFFPVSYWCLCFCCWFNIYFFYLKKNIYIICIDFGWIEPLWTEQKRNELTRITCDRNDSIPANIHCHFR